MKHLLITPFIVAFLGVTLTAPSLPLSVVRFVTKLETGEVAYCSGFSISQEKKLYLTAKHCLVPELNWNGNVMVPVYIDETDLAIVTTDVGLPEMTLGNPPSPRDVVESIGFPFEMDALFFVPGKFQTNADLGERVALFVGNMIPGMSGGPIVNTKDEVVSVVLGGGKPGSIVQIAGWGAQWEDLARVWKLGLNGGY